MNEFDYTNAYTLCKSIINQRLLLISLNKTQISNIDTIRIQAEQLRNEFDKYKSSKTSIAYFIRQNYQKLLQILPHNNGWQKRQNRLTEIYNAIA